MFINATVVAMASTVASQLVINTAMVAENLYFPEGHPLARHFKGMHEIVHERFKCDIPNSPNPNPPNKKKNKQ
jgi:hypothetical protein